MPRDEKSKENSNILAIFETFGLPGILQVSASSFTTTNGTLKMPCEKWTVEGCVDPEFEWSLQGAHPEEVVAVEEVAVLAVALEEIVMNVDE